MKIKNLLLITGNQGKAEEFKALLNIPELKISYLPLPLAEIQSLDIEEVGRHKTSEVFNFKEKIDGYDAVMTDDTGMTLDALNGLPGPLIKWFLKSIGEDGLVDLVKGKSAATTVTCLLTLGLTRNQDLVQFRGDIKGKIVPARGDLGFGWDTIFQPNGSELTYGEMSADQKNRISHRTLAVKKLRDWISTV